MTIEEPKFTLALQEGVFELRDYARRIVAEVTVRGDFRAAGQNGFRQLAAYIFGANSSGRKIAMTAPVTRIAATAPEAQGLEDPDWLVRFALPSSFALSALPRPTDPSVMLRDLPPDRFAVLCFSGMGGAVQVREETAKLLATAKARGLVSIGPVSVASYSPPWTPWFLRRNEVMLPVVSGA